MSSDTTTPFRLGVLTSAVLGLLVSALLWIAASAAPPPGTTPPVSAEVAEEIAAAPVIVDGVELFRVRGVSAFPAERRAQAIAERIKQLAQDRAISPGTLRVVEAEDRSNIVAAERIVMVVVDADAQLEGVSRQVLAQVYVARIVEAVKAHRHDRSPRVLLINTAYAAAAVLLLALAWLGVRWGLPRLDAALERRYKAKLHDLQIQSFRILQAEQLWAGLQATLRTVRLVLVLILLYITAHFVLSLYPWTRSFAQGLFAILLDPLHTMGAAVLAAVPNLVFIAILAVVTGYLLKLLRLFFAGIEHGTVTLAGFDREWAWPTYRIVRVVVIAFAVVVAYPYIPGSGSAAFQGVSIFLGVIFSLGSTSVIANIIAGYAMIYRRAFKVGDRIKIDEHMGDVVERRLLVTRLRSPKNEEIVVPNSVILNGSVINYSTLASQGGLILHTTVGIGYETPWRQVEAMLLLAAERTPGLLKLPPPFVLQRSLGDFCVTYEINVYCDQPSSMASLYTALHRNILDVFNEYGVQIMTPAYEGDPGQPKVVRKDQWFAAPAKPLEIQDGG